MTNICFHQVIAEYFAAIRAMDVESWLATFADDAVSYEPLDSQGLQGHKALSDFFQSLAGQFAKVGLKEEFINISGNKAAVKWKGTGIRKSGNKVIFEGIDIFEINSQGKIAKQWAYWNTFAMMTELNC